MAELWTHQEHVYDLLKTGHNVILQAPTGSGKTRAALYPFLCACDPDHEMWGKLPPKCVYSVPMRVLAKQFQHEYGEIVAQYNRKFALELSVRIQTGEEPRDPEFAASLIFATIDQTLSSFLVSPYGLPKRLANLNAAAVTGAYLVFDEFHLFDPESTLPTTLHMLKMLDGIAPFVLMTATFSADMLEGLAKALNAEIVPRNDRERAELLSLPAQQKTRRYHLADQPLSAEVVLDGHHSRSLVICNTVDRARHLYEDLMSAKDANTEVLLLHSRFLPEDRGQTEETIRWRFGKNDPGYGSLIVVSTQAIEVGLDITCERLHTELAPANAIIQRAGRCARYEGNEGDVFVYPSVNDPSGELLDLLANVNPYRDQEAEFRLTHDAFAERSGSVFTFADEQAILSAVHGERDQRLIEALGIGAPEHRRRMYAVMRGDENDDARHLVREVFQQRLTISSNPDSLLESPFQAPAFALHPGTLMGYISHWLEISEQTDPDDLPFAVKWLYQPRDPDPDQSNRSVYKWEKVWKKAGEVIGAPLVVVHPKLATYDPQLGFVPDCGGNWEARLPERQSATDELGNRGGYRLETYEAHIQQVYKAAFKPGGLWEELADVAARIERRFSLQPNSLRDAAELAVLLHDVGKLSQGWQRWATTYQKLIGKPPKDGQAYAHTDYQYGNAEHDAAAKRAGKRPWHAVEGALAVTPLLVQTYGEDNLLLKAIFSAIARHHAPRSDSWGEFHLTNDAARHVEATLRERRLSLEQLAGAGETIPAGNVTGLGADLIAEPGDGENAAFLIYLLLARVLRRADQRGTKRGSLGTAQ